MSNLLPVLYDKGAPMVLCEACPDPGHCCKRFSLFRNGDDALTFWLESWMDDARRYVRERNLPFEPLSVSAEYAVPDPLDPDFGKKYVTVYFGCPKLTPDGRCGIYAERPALCRRFTPRSSRLCVLPVDPFFKAKGN